jgi:hypothetical protein
MLFTPLGRLIIRLLMRQITTRSTRTYHREQTTQQTDFSFLFDPALRGLFLYASTLALSTCQAMPNRSALSVPSLISSLTRRRETLRIAAACAVVSIEESYLVKTVT